MLRKWVVYTISIVSCVCYYIIFLAGAIDHLLLEYGMASVNRDMLGFAYYLFVGKQPVGWESMSPRSLNFFGYTAGARQSWLKMAFVAVGPIVVTSSLALLWIGLRRVGGGVEHVRLRESMIRISLAMVWAFAVLALASSAIDYSQGRNRHQGVQHGSVFFIIEHPEIVRYSFRYIPSVRIESRHDIVSDLFALIWSISFVISLVVLYLWRHISGSLPLFVKNNVKALLAIAVGLMGVVLCAGVHKGFAKFSGGREFEYVYSSATVFVWVLLACVFLMRGRLSDVGN